MFLKTLKLIMEEVAQSRTELLNAESFLESLKAHRHVPPRLGKFACIIDLGAIESPLPVLLFP